MLKVGMKNELSVEVVFENTAAAVGSGLAEVFSTPSMIALMENASSAIIDENVPEGQGSVGTIVNVKHLAATPIGMTVRCESVIKEVDRKRIVFEVKAYDDAGLIGEGIHERFIIDKEKFMDKVNAKAH